VEVEAEGFKSYAQRYLQISLGRVVEVPIELQAGDSTEILALAASLVERSSTQIGAVVGSRAVVSLPLNARDTYQLLQFQPGVQAQQGSDLFAGSENPGVISVNGGRGRANNFNVNGGDANDLFMGVPAIQPSPDTIEEFRVLTNTFDAEHGRNSGAVINVVTKAGTNEFHASVLEFFRNRSLNTRGFFDTEKSKFNQNQYGGALGGRLVKDRTYFFVSSEQRAIRQGVSSDVVVVPSLAERSGDFSSGGPFTGSLADSYLADLLNRRSGCAAAATAAGGAPIEAGTPWASIFPGNQIPTPCFDPTAAALMQRFVPLPNSGGNLLQTVPVRSENATQYTIRLDQALGAQNQLSFYDYFDDSSKQQPFSRFQAAGANVPGFGSSYGTRNQQFNLSDTWSINAATVNEARFNWFREGQQQFNRPQRVNLVRDSCGTAAGAYCFSDPTNPALGITPNLGPEHEGVPSILVNGAFSIGNNKEGELPQVGNSFQWTDNFSILKGRHRLKFGADVRRQRFDQTLYYNVNGSFTFSDGGSNDVGADNQFPNFLLGLPSQYQQGSAQAENVRNTGLYLFAQDSWSVSKSITLNYGLRWELNTPMRDTRNRIQTFRPGQATETFPCRLDPSNPLVETFGGSDCGPGTAGESVFPLGLVVPGDRGIPAGLTATYYKSLAPRVGLAWSPSARTSVRTGWGIFYNPVEQLVLEQFSAQPPFGGSTGFSNTLFNTPFLGQDGSARGNPFNGMLNPKAGQPLDWSVFRPITLFGQFGPQMRSQYAMQYNFTIQRTLREDLLLQAAYVGAQGRRLLASFDMNYGRAQTCLDLNRLSELTGDGGLACGPFSADSAYTVPAGAIPAGFTLHLPYGPSASFTGRNPDPITLVGLRPYSSPSCNPLTGAGCPPDGVAVFGSIFAQDAIANSSYNSLQLSLEKRALAGLRFQAAYTFGKSIDNASSFESMLNPLNYRLSRSLSLFDARHRLVFSYDWELPSLNTRRLPKKVVNGWVLAGILTLQSGIPVPITSSDDLELMNSGSFTFPGEPDMVKPFRKLDPRNPENLAFDPSSFQQPEMGRIGTSPRSVCCGPGINNLDFSVMKNTSLTERFNMQFRAEFFNLANHAQFSKVDGDISSGQVSEGGTFGKVLRARDPRLIQFGVKLAF
jgi:hypothetical protein